MQNWARPKPWLTGCTCRHIWRSFASLHPAKDSSGAPFDYSSAFAGGATAGATTRRPASAGQTQRLAHASERSKQLTAARIANLAAASDRRSEVTGLRMPSTTPEESSLTSGCTDLDEAAPSAHEAPLQAHSLKSRSGSGLQQLPAASAALYVRAGPGPKSSPMQEADDSWVIPLRVLLDNCDLGWPRSGLAEASDLYATAVQIDLAQKSKHKKVRYQTIRCGNYASCKAPHPLLWAGD
jgi:hypothetical protein